VVDALPDVAAPEVTVTGVIDIAVVAPVEERLHRRSDTGLLAHAPLVADHVAAAPLICTVQARFPRTVKLADVGLATPAATFMSDIVAVTASGESGDDVGDTVSDNSAGFVIVAGVASETSGEHLPLVPVTEHEVCALAVATDPLATHDAARTRLMRLSRCASRVAFGNVIT
jgi:hypothetical protein